MDLLECWSGLGSIGNYSRYIIHVCYVLYYNAIMINYYTSCRPQDESLPTVKPDWIVDNLEQAVDRLLQ